MKINDEEYDPNELEIRDNNGCPCCFPLIEVTVGGNDFLELLKLAGESEELIKQTEERFESVSEANYSRLLIEEELIRKSWRK